MLSSNTALAVTLDDPAILERTFVSYVSGDQGSYFDQSADPAFNPIPFAQGGGTLTIPFPNHDNGNGLAIAALDNLNFGVPNWFDFYYGTNDATIDFGLNRDAQSFHTGDVTGNLLGRAYVLQIRFDTDKVDGTPLVNSDWSGTIGAGGDIVDGPQEPRLMLNFSADNVSDSTGQFTFVDPNGEETYYGNGLAIDLDDGTLLDNVSRQIVVPILPNALNAGSANIWGDGNFGQPDDDPIGAPDPDPTVFNLAAQNISESTLEFLTGFFGFSGVGFSDGGPIGNFVLERFDTVLPGDANLDGVVDAADLAIVQANFGANNQDPWVTGDFTGDRIVNEDDLAFVTLATAVPEPSTGVLLAFGSLFLASRRRPVRR